MPPKTNSKAAAGRARKEETANAKKSAENAKQAAQEDAKWEQGAKGKSKTDDKAEKAAAAAAKKAELERLKKEEEDSLPDVKKAAPKAGAKKTTAPKKNEFGSRAGSSGTGTPGGLDDALTSFSASNLDDAIAAMDLVSESSAKDKLGAKAGQIEAHPERRFKAAFEAYKENEMPRIRQERPGLRKQQYENELFDEFKKSPLNPFNQVTVEYNASKEDKLDALQKGKAAVARRLAD